jgi:hypothetical protein
MASAVSAPWPISERATRMVTVSSGAITTQQLTSAGWAVLPAGSLPVAGAKPSVSAPAAALTPTTNDRRSGPLWDTIAVLCTPSTGRCQNAKFIRPVQGKKSLPCSRYREVQVTRKPATLDRVIG